MAGGSSKKASPSDLSGNGNGRGRGCPRQEPETSARCVTARPRQSYPASHRARARDGGAPKERHTECVARTRLPAGSKRTGSPRVTDRVRFPPFPAERGSYVRGPDGRWPPTSQGGKTGVFRVMKRLPPTEKNPRVRPARRERVATTDRRGSASGAGRAEVAPKRPRHDYAER